MSAQHEALDGHELDAPLGNLPGQLTRLIGRRGAIDDLRARLWQTRLLTLCGPGGAGKTRLSIALAEAVRAEFAGGAWWIDLSATVDDGMVAQEVAATLLPGEPADDPLAAVARNLTQPALLVLDNCEQVIDGCAEAALRLLQRCPELRLIATSRRSLGVLGEHVWRVPGLGIGDPGEGEHGDGDESRGAVELFVERAGEAMNSFRADDPETVEVVRQICRRLDGIPLAIELAAARVPVLGVRQIAARLERDASFLRSNRRTAPARQRTLHEALEWSHRLLEPAERALFRRLAVFRGSFALEAAQVVCADDPHADALDSLARLVDQSLVQVVEGPSEPRYRLMSTVRQYAAEQLEASGESAVTRERHARFFYRLALEAQPPGNGGHTDHLDRLELERDNFSEALRTLIASPQEGAVLASLLWPFWYRHGYYREARRWLDRMLSTADAIGPEARAQLLISAGEVAFMQCDYEVAEQRLQAALTATEELSDRRATARALQRLGSIAREQARYDQARSLHEQSLEIWASLGNQAGVASACNYLGFIAWLVGDTAVGESLCKSALDEFRAVGAQQEISGTLINFGACALYAGDLQAAEERLREALAIARQIGFQEAIAWSLHELSLVSRRRRRPTQESIAMLREALIVHRQLGDRWRVASVLEEIAASVLVRQDPRLAVQTLAAAEALRQRLGAPVPPAEKPDRDAALAQSKRRLAPNAFASAWAEGQAGELDQTIDLVVGAIDQLGGAERGPTEAQPPTLTSRELAVLELLSDGHTNREIARALYISPSTAGVHVSNVLRKLGARRRVEAAGLAHQLGLVTAA